MYYYTLRGDRAKREARNSDPQNHFGNFKQFTGFKLEFLGMLGVVQLTRSQSLRERRIYLAQSSLELRLKERPRERPLYVHEDRRFC